MPKSRTYLGAWGEADVYVNGAQVYKNLMGHIMYTERTRDTKTRAVYNKDKSGFFSPMDPTNGSIAAPTEKDIHFVAHSMEKDPDNFPGHSAWIHLNFENVENVRVGSGKLINCSYGATCNCPQDGKGGCGCKLL